MSATSRLDAFQRRHHAAGFPLAVLYKYVDDSGAYLAALITYYAFVSLFPLLLLSSTILGFVLVGHPEVQRHLLNSALHKFPVVGSQLDDPKRIGGGAGGLVVGIAGSLYGGLGVGQAIQYAMNTAWRVPRNRRLNPLKTRARSVLLLLIAAVTFALTAALSVVGSSGVGSIGVGLRVLALAASVAINALGFIAVFRLATTRALMTRDVAVGALVAALTWQVLQSFGVVYVGHVVRNASATNGVFAFVLGLIAFLFLTSAVLVVCVEINVVHIEHLYPRSLLTPFTDRVVLTAADRRAYTTQAETQQMKGFQGIDVTFEQRPPEVSVTVVDAGSPGARWALGEYFAELTERFLRDFDARAAIDQAASKFNPPAGLFILAGNSGTPVGCGGVQFLDDERGEIKRMWVARDARGKGLATQLLGHLEGLIAESGRSTVVLDTNSALTEAVALYERHGYRSTERYNDNMHADRWFTKSLRPAD